MANALVVGRFQPFHNGHMELIEHLSKMYEKVVIVIGSADQSGTIENPFTAKEREEMIRLALTAKGIKNFTIGAVRDFHNDRLWAYAVKKCAERSTVFTRNPWTLRCLRNSGMKVRKNKFYSHKRYSGREIRRRIAAGKKWDTLVPPEVFSYIMSNRGAERVKKLAGSK
ncbi:MAG: nicotinamide-nucleotide adenylyltransferase [Candidatus Aenigmarchaeota archaeon]|nr:nicotinamide-nucleotide adenylyltransferase [Candidatus Aenigmarchaeota archaeon]